MSNDERLWWNILVIAEALSEIASNLGDGQLALYYHIVAAKARITLRDKFVINLDDLGMKAKEQVMEMVEAEAEKDRAEKARIEEALKALDRTEELLGIKK